MAHSVNEKFRFLFDENSFTPPLVIHFTGTEGLSECWQFQIVMRFNIDDLKTDGKFSLKKLINLSGSFKMATDDDLIYKGRIIHAELVSYSTAAYAKAFCFVKITFVPELYTLSFFTRNRTFLDMDVKTLLKNIMKTNPNIKADYKLSKTYTSKPIASQKEESDLAFLNRIISKYGLYYSFEYDDDDGYQVIFRDSAADDDDAYEYEHDDDEFIADLTAKMKSVPDNVRIRDYNYRTAATDIDHSINDNKAVMEFIHNNVKDEEEAKKIASVRYDQLVKDMLSFTFTSDIWELSPGSFLEMEDVMDDKLLIVHRTITGNQVSLLSEQLRTLLNIEHNNDQFTTTVKAVFSDVCYRPDIDFINARAGLSAAEVSSHDGMTKQSRPAVDTKPSSPVDADGNYFLWLRDSEIAVEDNSPASNESFSSRNMTPYAGKDHGFHMPLQTGDEVLINCEDGNIDKPVIQGTVNNSRGTGLYNSKATQLHTTGNNIIKLDDDSLNGIDISTPAYTSSLKMGKIDDENAIHLKSDKGILIKGKSEVFELEAEFKITGGNNYNIRIGAFQKYLLGLGTFVLLGAKLDLKFDICFDFSTMKLKCHGHKLSIAGLKHNIKGECTKLTDEQQEVIDTKIESYTEDESAEMEEIEAIKERIQTAINDTADSVEASRVAEEQVEALVMNEETHLANVTAKTEEYEAAIVRSTNTAVTQATRAVNNRVAALSNRTGELDVNLTGFRKCGAV